MESSSKSGISLPVLAVLYDFRYMWKGNREISVRKGEKLLLIEKTNRDWWQVVRPAERKSFFVPAQYLEPVKKNQGKEDGDDESVLYENLDGLKQQANISSFSRMFKPDLNIKGEENGKSLRESGRHQKPVPKTRTKISSGKSLNDKSSDLSKLNSLEEIMKKLDSDKVDNSRSDEKLKEDFFSSFPKEFEVGPVDVNRGKSTPLAVENLVYCNVSVEGKKIYHKVNSGGFQNRLEIDSSKNRMKNSYNLKAKPSKKTGEPFRSQRSEIRQNSLATDDGKLKFDQNLSKSLEKLAEEIRFEPKNKVVLGSKSSSADNHNSGGGSSKAKPTVKMQRENSDKMGKSNDASVVLDENKVQPQSRSMLFRFRRSLHHSNSFKSNNSKKSVKNSGGKAFELSLSWEGGLDKIQEKKMGQESELPATPLGLQRSRTFMFAERSPTTNARPENKLFSAKHRLDTAYHSQRKPDEKVTLSTFKPILNPDSVTRGSFEPRGSKKFEKELENRGGLAERQRVRAIISGSLGGKRSNEALPETKSEISPKATIEADRVVQVHPQSKKGSKENVTKAQRSPGAGVAPAAAIVDGSQDSRRVGERAEISTFHGEPYFSNSESEDNLEEKSLTLIANKSIKSQSSIDSILTVSEGTEASESDENCLDFALENSIRFQRSPLNKRRTSLVRNSRVESSKVRKVAARLPLTPPPDLKPMKDLGDGWGQYISKGGRSFYYNVKTKEKNWKPPRKMVGAQEVPLLGSYESICSDTNRSNTSSPLNENCRLVSPLNFSNGSLHSKLATFSNSNLETPKSGSVSRWKEESPEDLNRSSYNSSPITGLSQSSGYSLNKSSRDSLNRFSPIDNIPSEEEGFELHDHVYKNENSTEKKESDSRQEEGGRSSKESLDGATFRIKPGWEEFYDENLDQIYYVYKDRKEKWILSFDSEERAYFFEETSNKSLWALPDYSCESSKDDFNFFIQRSATESHINNSEIGSKLRQIKDGGDKIGRISGSARSSKAQSMLIEPKFDVSANNSGNKAFSMPRDLSRIYGEIILFGVLNKTKILENGKKLRKNWTPSFVVLTDSYLFFFKDAKSFQNMKNIVSPSNNHSCHSLQGAVIEKGAKISSRKNVYKISFSDNTDVVLIQTEKTAEAEDWFKEIGSVIRNLPQEPDTASNSPLLDLSSPSKVGRTKSLKVRTKETGSMEDLSSSHEERQNKIKAKLKKFFIRRPTVDSLKKKGIWKDEPVFGCSLEQITKNRNPRVPIFVEKCIECIESKEENMKTDGLYRASGNLSQVQKIRLEVDQNNLNIMKDEEDVHVLTGSLKLFFRELKEPLIPSKQLEPALLATDKQIRKERIKDFQKIVRNLPAPNYDTLKFLLQHLLRVKEYHKFNRMNINNLAIVFGPTLMWPEHESANMALELMQQNVVIECLLKEFQEIFT